MKNTVHTLFLGSLAAAIISACASLPKGPDATAQLEGRSGTASTGNVSFTAIPGGVKIEANISGLTPGEHGFHIHEVGDCSAPDASSAKGHFNPATKSHGHHSHAEHHAGDMPNLNADTQGKATLVAELQGVELTGNNGIVGRSVVIHADPDDYKSQPAGNSGKRIACGVISAR